MVVGAHEEVAAASPQQTAPRVPRRRGALSDATLRALVEPPNEVAERRLRRAGDAGDRPRAGRPRRPADVVVPLRAPVPRPRPRRRAVGVVAGRPHAARSPGVCVRGRAAPRRRRPAPDLRRRLPRERGLVAAFDAVDRALPGPGTSRYVQRSVSLPQWQELLVSKSIYQLKEADPHSWAIPRLAGDAKTALVEIQYDEYGAGRRGRQHSQLFAETMRLCGLDPALRRLPGRRTRLRARPQQPDDACWGCTAGWWPASLGHLALYESTSCLPNKHYAVAARRLGLPEDAVTYFDEHVEADADPRADRRREHAGCPPPRPARGRRGRRLRSGGGHRAGQRDRPSAARLLA